MVKEKGFVSILLIFVLSVLLALGAGYYLGRQSNKQEPIQSTPEVSVPNPASPTIAVISQPKDVANWTTYKIKALSLEFKLPEDLASKYGKLIENESNGKRGSELNLSFANDPKSLILTAQSFEYIPYPKPEKDGASDSAIGGPPISTPSVFQGFKYESEVYYGILPYGQLRSLPKDKITQYHINGMDILKVKALYSDYGMAKNQIYPENPPKIWGIVSGVGGQVYQGITVQGVLDNGLTDEIFEQILSTFKIVN